MNGLLDCVRVTLTYVHACVYFLYVSQHDRSLDSSCSNDIRDVCDHWVTISSVVRELIKPHYSAWLLTYVRGHCWRQEGTNQISQQLMVLGIGPLYR